jgi:exodeoxyribonuclease V alpha subunit
VERVTFHSPESGFCVLRVKVRGHRELVTVVGAAAAITAGEFVQASGSWVNDRTHGLQFRAAFLRSAPPTTLEGIERYLGSGMVKGIGPVYAGRLVAAFGEGVFDVIEAEPAGCREVGGIGPKRAGRIVRGWADQKVVREIMLFLHSHGVGTSRRCASSRPTARTRSGGSPRTRTGWRATSAASASRPPTRSRPGSASRRRR